MSDKRTKGEGSLLYIKKTGTLRDQSEEYATFGLRELNKSKLSIAQLIN